MDAIQLVSKKAAFLLAFALLAVAPWQAGASPVLLGTLIASPSSFVLTSAAGSTQSVTVTASDSSAQQFTVSVTFQAGDPAWLAVPASDSTCADNPTYNTGGASGVTFTVGLACYSYSLQLSAGTHTATVNLNGSGYTGSFTVSYTQGGSGSGLIAASPSSLVLCAPSGSGTSGTVTLTTSSVAAISFSDALTPPVSGASLSATSNAVASGANAAIGVQVAAGTQSFSTTLVVGYNSTTLNIPVSFTVNGSCSPTGTGTLPLSQNVIYWSYSTSSPVTQTTTVAVNSTTSYGAYVSNIIGGVPWLSLYTSYDPTPSTATNGTAGATLFLETNGNAQSLATGSYQATVTVNDQNGNVGYITVNLSVNGAATTGITASPNPIILSAYAGQATVAQTTVYVTSSIAGTVTAYESGTGLANPAVNGAIVTAGGSTTITVYGYPGGLGQNTYSGSLIITVTGTGQTLQQSFPVYFEVGTTGIGFGTVGSSVAPAALQFNYEIGQATPPAQGIMIGGISTFVVSSTMTTGTGWLSTNVTTGGQAPGEVFAVVSPTSLAAGVYTGTVTVTFGDGTPAQSVAVTLTVVSSTPLVYAVPGTVIFNQAGTNPSTYVWLYATDGSTIPLHVTTSASWVTITSALPTTTQSSFQVQVNTAGLSNGLNTGSITVTYNGGATALTIPVVAYVLNGTVGGGYLTFTADSLSFTGQVGNTVPAQTLYVSAPIATYFTAAVVGENCNANWLSISYTPATVYLNYSQPVSVSVNTSGLTAETCTGTIAFTANGQTQTIPVTLTLTGGGLTATPGTLSFSYNGSGSVASQPITLTNSSSNPVSYTAAAVVTTPSGGTWLSIATTSGTVTNGSPYSLSVSVNPTGLAASTTPYTGTVTVTPSGGTALIVAVSLTVTETAISAPSTPLSFSYAAGGTTPAPQTISVSGGSFTASASVTTPSGGIWLAVGPTSGTAATTLSVSVNPAGLAASTTPYSGTVTVTGTNGATGTVSITVTLTVTAPLPTITGVVNAASGASGAVSPGEVIEIFGTNLGPSSPLFLTVSNGSVSTSLCVTGSTACVSVTVGGTPAPLIYAGSGQINAVVPYEVSILTAPTVVVSYQGQNSNGFALQTVVASPGILTQNQSGSGPGAILNQNGITVNGPSSPAPRNSIVEVFMTGEGVTTPTHVTGKVNIVTNPSQLPVPLLPVSALVGGLPAQVVFAAEAPGLVSGVLQVNVLIPATVGTGNLPIVISLGTYASQAGVTVSVQ